MDPVQTPTQEPVQEAPATSAPVETPIAPVSANPATIAPVSEPAPATETTPSDDFEWDGVDWGKIERVFEGRPKLAASVKTHIERLAREATDLKDLEKFFDVDTSEIESKLKAKDEELAQLRNHVADLERWQDDVAAKDFERYLQTHAKDVWEYQDADGNYAALKILLENMNDRNLPFEDALVLARARIPKPGLKPGPPAPPSIPRSVAGSRPPTKSIGDTKPRYEDMDPYEAMAHMSRNAR